ncbi:hypothetical protein BDZ45DRAFT_9713 [Acephala macrosclerotiorum]|nr:hypothetical protein BDZ45DRAFT_9713 [Acephala macrosclerotiorum]
MGIFLFEMVNEEVNLSFFIVRVEQDAGNRSNMVFWKKEGPKMFRESLKGGLGDAITWGLWKTVVRCSVLGPQHTCRGFFSHPFHLVNVRDFELKLSTDPCEEAPDFSPGKMEITSGQFRLKRPTTTPFFEIPHYSQAFRANFSPVPDVRDLERTLPMNERRQGLWPEPTFGRHPSHS